MVLSLSMCSSHLWSADYYDHGIIAMTACIVTISQISICCIVVIWWTLIIAFHCIHLLYSSLVFICFIQWTHSYQLTALIHGSQFHCVYCIASLCFLMFIFNSFSCKTLKDTDHLFKLRQDTIVSVFILPLCYYMLDIFIIALM